MGRVRILLKQNWRFLFTLLFPIVLLILPLVWYHFDENVKNVPLGAYVIVLMAGYFMTECLPLPITALIPVFIYPILGIQDTGQVTSNYLKDSTLFLLGGCIIALAFEYSNLHMRIAMKTITLVGSKTPQLLFGIMTVSMILSMWMNNTSTTALMVPICSAIVHEIKLKMVQFTKNPRGSVDLTSSGDETDMTKEEKSKAKVESWMDKQKNAGKAKPDIEDVPLTPEQEASIEKEAQKLKVLFLLGAAYAAGIGGTGLITGTASNLVALDIFNNVRDKPRKFVNPEKCMRLLEVDFLTWFEFNVFSMIINVYITWFFLLSYFTGLPDWMKCWKKKNPLLKKEQALMEKSLKRVIKKKHKALGRMSLHEILVTFFFVLMVVLWVFRSPKIFPGWADLIVNYLAYEKGQMYELSSKFKISDASSTLLVCIFMFFIPRKAKHYREWRTGGIGRGMLKPVLTWQYVLKKIPWGVFILLGGGGALASGTKASGFNDFIVAQLGSPNSFISKMPSPAILIFALVFAAILTGVASNLAAAAILVPVFLELSFEKGLHPYYLVLSATTVCSYAFILPVSTPPNAIVYDAGGMKSTDMLLPGLVVTGYTVVVKYLVTQFIGTAIWKFNRYEDGVNNYCKLLK